MRHLLDDFRRQSWAMKLFLLWGWLAVVIMVSSFITSVILADPRHLRQAPDPGNVALIAYR